MIPALCFTAALLILFATHSLAILVELAGVAFYCRCVLQGPDAPRLPWAGAR